MDCIELIRSSASETAVRGLSSNGNQVADTIRMLNEPARIEQGSAAIHDGMSFNALVRQGLIQQLAAMR